MTPLNKAAAIATIIGTAIAALGVFMPKSDHNQVAASSWPNNEAVVPALTKKSSDLSDTNSASKEISVAGAGNRDIDKAVIDERMKIALLISATFTKDQKLQELSSLAADNGYYGKAVEVANHISASFTKDSALSYIAKKARASKNLQDALDAAKGISATFTRDQIYSEISSE